MPNYKNTKYVKRLESGAYSITSEKQLNAQKDLCSMCGIQSACPIFSARQTLLNAGAEFHLGTCMKFVPVITFRKPHLGLNATYFNTLRAGVTWDNRLEKGSIVCLADAETGEHLRFMKVDHVFTGAVGDVLSKHSRFNHLAVGGEPVSKVEHVIRKSYGNFLKADSSLTAIYFRTIRPDFDYQYHSDAEIRLIEDCPIPDNVVPLHAR